MSARIKHPFDHPWFIRGDSDDWASSSRSYNVVELDGQWSPLTSSCADEKGGSKPYDEVILVRDIPMFRIYQYPVDAGNSSDRLDECCSR